jgi:hypothetical protein
MHAVHSKLDEMLLNVRLHLIASFGRSFRTASRFTRATRSFSDLQTVHDTEVTNSKSLTRALILLHSGMKSSTPRPLDCSRRNLPRPARRPRFQHPQRRP